MVYFGDFRRRIGHLFVIPVFAMSVFLAGCGGEEKPTVQTQRLPNILLISLDALRADGVGSYGCSRDTTPFLDELASQGTLFTNAFANTHGTPPSHSTMLTSLYQETHQVGCPVARETPRNDALPTGITLVHELLRDHGYLTIGVTDGGYMSSVFGFDRGFDLFWDRGDGVTPGANQLMRFLEDSWNGDQPVFALFHTYEIHSPYEPPGEYGEAFGTLPTPVDASNEFLLPIQDDAHKHLTENEFSSLRQLYDAGTRYTDDVLRSLFSQLESSGFLDNALVIITSDHGEEFGDHGGLLHRATLYEELLRVPLILYGTGITPGETVSNFAGLVDLAPTILKTAGLAVPETMAGIDLLGRDQPKPAEDVVFAQYGDLKYSVRLGDWKLIETPRYGGIELYNLAVDPREQTNVAPSHSDVVQELGHRIEEWRNSLPSLDHVRHELPELTEEHRKRLEALGYVE